MADYMNHSHPILDQFENYSHYSNWYTQKSTTATLHDDHRICIGCLHTKLFTKATVASSFLLFRLLLRFWRWKLERLGCPVNTRANLFPGAGSALKVTVRLSELQGLRDDALLLLVVPDLRVASHGEVFTQRVTLKSVIGHDTAEVRVADKEDTEQVVDFALVPIGAIEEANDARNRRGLVGVRLDPDSGVVADAEEVVNDLEPLVASGEVDGGNVADLGELSRGVVCHMLAVLLVEEN